MSCSVFLELQAYFIFFFLQNSVGANLKQSKKCYTITSMLLLGFGLDVAPWTLVVMVREVSSYQSKIYFYTVLLHSLPQPGVYTPSLNSQGQDQVENGAAHVRSVHDNNVLCLGA